MKKFFCLFLVLNLIFSSMFGMNNYLSESTKIDFTVIKKSVNAKKSYVRLVPDLTSLFRLTIFATERIKWDSDLTIKLSDEIKIEEPFPLLQAPKAIRHFNHTKTGETFDEFCILHKEELDQILKNRRYYFIWFEPKTKEYFDPKKIDVLYNLLVPFYYLRSNYSPSRAKTQIISAIELLHEWDVETGACKAAWLRASKTIFDYHKQMLIEHCTVLENLFKLLPQNLNKAGNEYLNYSYKFIQRTLLVNNKITFDPKITKDVRRYFKLLKK